MNNTIKIIDKMIASQAKLAEGLNRVGNRHLKEKKAKHAEIAFNQVEQKEAVIDALEYLKDKLI